MSDPVAARLRACRLIAVDMDGTCLADDASVSPRTREVLGRVIASGRLVVPASGRGMHDVLERLGVPGIRYGITANGAALTDVERGARLRERFMPRELACEVVGALLKRGTVVYVHENDALSTHIWGCAHPDDAPRVNGGKALGQVFADNPIAAIAGGTEQVQKVGVMFCEPWTFEQIEGTVAEHWPELTAFRVDRQSVELTAAGASKHEALTWLCDHLGIPLEQVCAIGDNGNDLKMIEAVGLGVAMRNARDDVKAAADCVTEFGNNKDGAARFLEMLLDGPSRAKE